MLASRACREVSYLHRTADPLSHSQQDGVERREMGSLGWSRAGIPAADSTQGLLTLCCPEWTPSRVCFPSTFTQKKLSQPFSKKKGLLARNEAGTLISVSFSLSLENPWGCLSSVLRIKCLEVPSLHHPTIWFYEDRAGCAALP